MELIKTHPPVVHFAIAFPVFLLVVDIYYRIIKKELDGLHALLTYLSVLAVVGGSISGTIAHEPVEKLLENITIFNYHEVLGLFLALYFLALGLVRFYKKRNLFTIMLLIGVLLLFLQGWMGGVVVYEHLVKTQP
jgi:uncharacterized membrane protein